MATDDNVTCHRPLHLTFIDMMTIGGIHLNLPAIHIVIANGNIGSAAEKAVAVAEKMIAKSEDTSVSYNDLCAFGYGHTIAKDYPSTAMY